LWTGLLEEDPRFIGGAGLCPAAALRAAKAHADVFCTYAGQAM